LKGADPEPARATTARESLPGFPWHSCPPPARSSRVRHCGLKRHPFRGADDLSLREEHQLRDPVCDLGPDPRPAFRSWIGIRPTSCISVDAARPAREAAWPGGAFAAGPG